jgi:dihydroorotase
MHDLVLTGGRLVDPANGVDGRMDIAFSGGKVAAVAADLSAAPAKARRDVSRQIVTPGLIDLHTHVYWGGTSLGVDASALARRSGTTTFVDAGSAGAGNFHGFRRHVIEPSPVKIVAYLNISYPGIYAFSATTMVGECQDIRLLDLRECKRVADENRDLIIGIKVRVGRGASGTSGISPLDMAIEVAEELGMPVMAHLDYPPPSRLEVLSRMRSGDVLTHCFRPFPNAPWSPRLGVRDEVLAARSRGIVFDIGHGGGSFGFETTRGMLAAGFAPDVISSDVHVLSIDGPAFDMAITMSKFICLGMPLAEVVARSTSAPARVIGRPDLGHLGVGATGDAAVFDLAEGAFRYLDVLGEVMEGSHQLVAKGVVLDGHWWHPGPV